MGGGEGVVGAEWRLVWGTIKRSEMGVTWTAPAGAPGGTAGAEGEGGVGAGCRWARWPSSSRFTFCSCTPPRQRSFNDLFADNQPFYERSKAV